MTRAVHGPLGYKLHGPAGYAVRSGGLIPGENCEFCQSGTAPAAFRLTFWNIIVCTECHLQTTIEILSGSPNQVGIITQDPSDPCYWWSTDFNFSCRTIGWWDDECTDFRAQSDPSMSWAWLRRYAGFWRLIYGTGWGFANGIPMLSADFGGIDCMQSRIVDAAIQAVCSFPGSRLYFVQGSCLIEPVNA